MQPRYNTDISSREDRDNFYTKNSYSHDGNHELLAPSQSSNTPTSTIKKSIPIKLSSADDSLRNRSPETHGNSIHKSSTENTFPNSHRNSPTSRTKSPNNSSPRSSGSPTSSTTILPNFTAPTSNNLEAPMRTSNGKDTSQIKLDSKSLREQNESGSLPSSPTTNSPTRVSAIPSPRTQLQVVNVAIDLNTDNNMAIVEDENLKLHSLGTKYSNRDSKYPILHTCPSCNIPVAVFARLVPCQHMCCYPCAQSSNCNLCSSPITSFTQIQHDPTLPGGGIFVCQQDNCKRSYLSEFSISEHQRLRSHGPFTGIIPTSPASTTTNVPPHQKSSSQNHFKSNSSGSSTHSSSSYSKQTSPPHTDNNDKHPHHNSNRNNSERDTHDIKRRPNNQTKSNFKTHKSQKNMDPADYHEFFRSRQQGNRASSFNKQPHKQQDPRYNPYY